MSGRRLCRLLQLLGFLSPLGSLRLLALSLPAGSIPTVTAATAFPLPVAAVACVLEAWHDPGSYLRPCPAHAKKTSLRFGQNLELGLPFVHAELVECHLLGIGNGSGLSNDPLHQSLTSCCVSDVVAAHPWE